MKTFLVGLATFIICFTFLLYQEDMNMMLTQARETKYEASSLANAMALYYSESAFSEGHMVLNDTEIMKFAVAEIDTDVYHYEVSVIDDLGTLRYYKDGALNSTTTATMPYTYQDSSGYQVTVVQPSVIVTLTRQGDYFKGLYPEFNKIVRTSNYALQPRSVV